MKKGYQSKCCLQWDSEEYDSYREKEQLLVKRLQLLSLAKYHGYRLCDADGRAGARGHHEDEERPHQVGQEEERAQGSSPA